MLIAGLIVAAYVALLFAIVWFSMYPIRTPLFFAPGALGLEQENIEVPTYDGLKLRGWWVPADSSRVIIFLHGYIMNRSEMAPYAILLAARGYNCLLIDFPTHGRSPRRKCGLGWTERKDVLACVEYVRKRVPGARVALMGSSMGAAAAAFASAEDKSDIAGLILDSPYDRMSEAILGWWNFLGGKWLTAFLLPTLPMAAAALGVNPGRVRVSEAIAKAELPTLILHGDCDLLASPAGARRNHAAAGEFGRLELFERCNHSEGRWIHPERYNRALFDFVDEVFAHASSKTTVSSPGP